LLKEDFDIETRFGTFRLEHTNRRPINSYCFDKGTWNLGESILTRINSSQVNNDLLGTLTNNVDQQWMMFRVINDEGKALLFYQSRHAINIY
jgi:3,4-dihydroxy 2-butanone 4-phosphate synthase/GTP cyclohydrolase II